MPQDSPVVPLSTKLSLAAILNPDTTPLRSSSGTHDDAPTSYSAGDIEMDKETLLSPIASMKKKPKTRHRAVHDLVTHPDTSLFLALADWLHRTRPPLAVALLDRTFHVSSDDLSAPPLMRGLTFNVDKLRQAHKKRQLQARFVARLDAMGFVWDVPRYKWERTVRALRHFKEIEGHVRVPQKKVVAHGDMNWPRECWGLRLGDRVHNYRLTKPGMPKWKQAELDALGFEWDGLKKTHSFEEKLAALQMFRDTYGHLEVKQTDVLPNADIAWPGQEIALGRVVNKLRQAKQSLPTSYIVELNKLGFLWRASASSSSQQQTK
ncbi:Aste57867_10157 [Aphanomyces stellatus]|uniref:Aste57867_10157 protein n=1 Tax=Aphanomyces stellatus TaxID=120398 RepID=A0A485KQ42_9STRA|nr:hypothetical protein As57867_010118 [Aphanomyces stellatus]VFT87033.1 Aste57867_10157 [Aphanomyces stellatus]